MRASQRWMAGALALALATTIVACGDKKNPTTPTAATATGTGVAGSGGSGTSGTNATNPDGSTLKVTAPTNLAPANSVRVDSRTPTLQWTNAAGVYQAGTFTYQLEFYRENTLVSTVDVNAGAGTSVYLVPANLDYNIVYRWRVRAKLAAAVGPWSATANFLSPNPPTTTTTTTSITGGGGGGGVGPRTPDPAPGTRLPLPNMAAVIVQVAGQYPAALRNSCQDHGGTWEFMDAVVDTLRANYDTRWGYNCKRGNCGDPSLDVIAYHYGAGNDEGNAGVYIIDIIAGHCGSSPGPTWNDVTQTTIDARSSGGFTSRGRFGQGQLAGGGVTVAPLPPVQPGNPAPVNGRTPDPSPGYRLPLPDMSATVFGMGSTQASDLQNSCGNYVWLDKVIDRLRAVDTRWGYNCKRGDCSTIAQDEITYHWGTGPDASSTQVYTIDVIVSHCGATPAAGWRNFTGEEAAAWSGRGRF